MYVYIYVYVYAQVYVHVYVYTGLVAWVNFFIGSTNTFGKCFWASSPFVSGQGDVVNYRT